ncbi:hypothetical protein [Halorussus salinus]|uniref:hypothetical protein n=1 Tax=Halorussus salinus TaxID=1364935 RepID=UPI001091E5F5|nr:hypothetical protein [Halorussus salinus]
MGQTPEYTAVYTTRTAREVRSVAAETVVPAAEAELANSVDTGEEVTFGAQKTVVFESGILYELAAIPFGEEYPQAHRYTELGGLRRASITDELFERYVDLLRHGKS